MWCLTCPKWKGWVTTIPNPTTTTTAVRTAVLTKTMGTLATVRMIVVAMERTETQQARKIHFVPPTNQESSHFRILCIFFPRTRQQSTHRDTPHLLISTGNAHDPAILHKTVKSKTTRTSTTTTTTTITSTCSHQKPNSINSAQLNTQFSIFLF